MTGRQKIPRLRSHVFFLLARLIPSLLGFVTTAVLTRLLGPAEYGLYALGLSIIFILTIGAFEWLGLSVVRMAPTIKHPDPFFGTVMTSFGAVLGLCAVAAALVLGLGGYGDYWLLTTACLIATAGSAWLELKQRLQLAELRETAYLWTSTGRGVVTVLLVCSTAFYYGTAASIVLALGISVILVGILVPEPRLNFRRYRFDADVFRMLFRFGLPLSISVGLATILMSVDKWLLLRLLGPRAVGLFTAATLVAQVPILTLASSIGPSGYSLAIRALEFESPEAAGLQLSQNFVILFGIVVPAATGIIGLSGNLGHLLVGQAFWQSVVLLTPWLSAAAVLASMRSFYVDIAFQLARRTSLLIWTNLLAVATNVALDIWLIPLFHERGAAIASLGALFISLVVAAGLSRRVFRLPVPLADAGKIVASSAAMFAVLHAIAGFTGPLALALQIGAGALTYLAAMVALNVLGARERLRASMPRFRRWLLPSR